MANNVSNRLVIKCQDPDIMERIKKMILRKDKNNTLEFTMEILLPRSTAFADEEHSDLDWNNAFWGTKWDVSDYRIIDSGNTLTLFYSTPWSGNSNWVHSLCWYFHNYLKYSSKKDTCNLEIEHHYSDYPGNFGGIAFWKPGTEYSHKRYSYMEYLRNTDIEEYHYMQDMEKSFKSDGDSIRAISTPT